ncbi:MAG: hypothetical protein ACO3NJ_08595 [Candidatus Poseidoniaceae archaeon]
MTGEYTNIINGSNFSMADTMVSQSRFVVTAGDLEIDLSGATVEVDARLIQMRRDDTWSIVLERLRDARDAAIDAAIDAARDVGLPERGSAFRALIENCSLNKKPDQVLAAIHYLRDVEGVSDSPPRVVNQLFSDAGIEPPGNLSLYLNRLKERGLLMVPLEHGDKNRFSLLTEAGRAHLDKQSTS